MKKTIFFILLLLSTLYIEAAENEETQSMSQHDREE